MRIFARVPGVPHDTAGRDRVGAGVVPGGGVVRALRYGRGPVVAGTVGRDASTSC